ncbi:unnamed protein product [Hymenolepis diminuta]|uniref:C2H2-type domain-containing protein n=1 Tax=Hymenolepis diminuta TaxID=6216 RepID=A0A564Y8L6_HYMDI|nr:unnamed protein product [Hymenolepis diminuta]
MHISCVHEEAEPYACEICGKTFKQKYYLKEHISCVHEAISFKCSHCEKSLASKKSLNNHIARFHNSEVKPFSCEECGKLFALSIDVRKHVDWVHKGVRKSSVMLKRYLVE